MAFNSRAASVAAGALFGAYTGDITDNPIMGAVTAGMGATVGGLMLLPNADIQAMARVPKSISLNSSKYYDMAEKGKPEKAINIKEKVSNDLRNIVKLRDSIESDPENIEERYSQLSKYKKNLENIKQIANDYRYALPDVDKDFDSFVGALGEIDDEKFLQRVSPLISGDNFNLVNLNDLSARGTKVLSDKKLTIQDTLNSEEKVKKLSDYLKNILGNDVADAQLKAQLIVDRSIGSLTIKNGNVIFGDVNDNGKEVMLPLTGKDANGVRYHNAGGGKVIAARGYAPFTTEFMQGGVHDFGNGPERVEAHHFIKNALDPEMMLKDLGKNSPVSNILSDIKSMFAFDSSEVLPDFMGEDHKINNNSFINFSKSVDVGYKYNRGYDGSINEKRPFLRLSKVSSEDGKRSEVSSLRYSLSESLPDAGSLGLGVSGNDTAVIQTRKMGTISALAPMERSISGSVARDTVPYVSTPRTQALQNYLNHTGLEGSYSSSQVINKLDINNANAFNEMTSTLLKDSGIVLGDGFSLFNLDHSEVFANKSNIDIKIPLAKNTAIYDENLFNLLNSSNPREALKESNLVLDKGVLGVDSYGKSIKLPEQYSRGIVKDINILPDNNAVLRTEAVFDPRSEGIVKFFSTGSKSLSLGVNGEDFKTVSALGRMMNEGLIDFKDGNITSDLKEFQGIDSIAMARKALEDSKFSSYLSTNVSMIIDSNNSGMDKIQNYLIGGANQDSEELMKNAHVEDLIDFLKIGDNRVNNNSARIAGTLLMSLKSSEDLSATVLTSLLSPLDKIKRGKGTDTDYRKLEEYAKNGLVDKSVLNKDASQELIQRSIDQLSEAFRYNKDGQRYVGGKFNATAMTKLYNMVKVSGVSRNIESGLSNAIGSTGKGITMVGTGNKSRMSWNAYQQMRQSGWSREMLSKFGKVDDKLLYEMQSMITEDKFNKHSINTSIRGGESEFESILRNNTPEGRLSKIKDAFKGFNVTEDNPFLSYNLNYDKGGIKSLNFSIISTNRSGKYDYKDTELVKELDKRKLEILSLDSEWGRSSGQDRKIIEDKLKSSISGYETFRKSMFKGGSKNDPLKGVLSLYSDTSMQAELRPIGGTALKVNRFIERNSDNSYKAISGKAFMSEEGIMELSKRLGVKVAYKDFKLNGFNGDLSTIKRAGYFDSNNRWTPMGSIITREPAQGMLSSEFVDLLVDTTIKGGQYSIFGDVEGFGLKFAKSADQDQDQIAMMLSRLNNDEYREASNIASTLRKSYEPYLNMDAAMSPKGAKKTVSTVYDFDTIEELNSHLYKANYQGKIRKDFSPLATKLSINFNKAIQLSEASDDDKTLGRIAGYRNVENILKSSHLSTKEIANTATMPIESINAAREGYLAGNLTDKQYRTQLEKYIPDLLNADNAQNDVDKSHAKRAIDLLIDSEVKYSKEVNKLFSSPLDKDLSTTASMNSSLSHIMKSQDMFDMVEEVSPKQLYSGSKDVILDTFRKNKGLILGGLGAMAAANLIFRESPNFDNSRSESRDYSPRMLQTPSNYEEVENGIQTNKPSSNFIQPATYGSKSVRVQGSFENYNNYNPYGSFIDEQSNNLSTAIFGGNLRSAKLDITDF